MHMKLKNGLNKNFLLKKDYLKRKLIILILKLNIFLLYEKNIEMI